jgi:hypothetical protein
MALREFDITSYLIAMPVAQPPAGILGARPRAVEPAVPRVAGSGGTEIGTRAPWRPRPAEPAPACIPIYSGLLSTQTTAGRVFQRALEIAPGMVTWLLVTAPLWAGLLLPVPFAVAILAFDVFWLYLSATTAWRSIVGYRRLRGAERTDWRHQFRIARAFGRAFATWDEVFHVVIIPNYKEPPAILRRTLSSLAAQENARQLFIVLAMEAREHGAGQRARTLEEEFDGRFAGILSTFHPAGLPGEVVGKSSNENWAARIAKRHLVDERGYELGNLTVTSCDADTVFHPSYFACLTYKFATDPYRYRRFWQSPILLTNNIWEAPAPLRVGSALAGVHILSNLCKRDRVIFPQSTYSLSLRMADDAGYWDTEVIPEDWHMFLKCFYTFSGRVEVEPIYLPTGNDAVRARTTWRSFVEAYQQHKRHAWGASDIPFAVREMLAHGEMPRWRGLRRVIALTSNHLLWSTHWFLLSLGWWAPLAIGRLVGTETQVSGLHVAARVALGICLVPYVTMIMVDARLRPPKPAWWRRRHGVLAAFMWLALPVTSFAFSTVPALVAQTRLMLGRRLEYRVTEKA